MRKYLLLLTFILLNVSSNAQIPRINITFKENLVAQKANHYQQMMLCEQQKTANQNNYDVKYNSLDLTPDPAIAILKGIVEIDGEVTAPTLDRVELNFWDSMTITDVHRSDEPGVQLSYSRNNDILTVHLDSVYTQGEQFRIKLFIMADREILNIVHLTSIPTMVSL